MNNYFKMYLENINLKEKQRRFMISNTASNFKIFQLRPQRPQRPESDEIIPESDEIIPESDEIIPESSEIELQYSDNSMMIYKKSIQKIEKKIYIISNILSGGSRKYINDLINNYKNSQIIQISNREELITNNSYSPIDIILIQQLTYTNILPEDLININKKFGTKLVISLHEFCWFCDNVDYAICYHDSYLKNVVINQNIINLFNKASLIIYNSIFVKKEYSRYFSTKNMILVENNDIIVDYTTKRIPLIKDKTINIVNLQEYSEYKGEENIKLLIDKYKKYKEYTINLFIPNINIEEYKESNWCEYIINNNFHGLLHLNKFGETYSYALSKSINSGLPILYNNFGAFKTRIPKNVEHYIKVANNEKSFYNSKLLFKKFEEFLDYIIDNNGYFNKCNSNKDIFYKDTYNFLFEDNFIFQKLYNKIFNKVKPFAVYFPQFHQIKENDINYYEKMTDITNLMYFNKNYSKKLDEPCLKSLRLKNLIDYELTNKKIINIQIEIAKKYCIYGFATYYYWFSTNTITNNNSIMEKCYNLFFEKPLVDFKIFFIWANEDWTNNPAFNTREKITNEYTSTNFIKNIDNLIKYFKHDNYYKIDNKPIFYIHHPFLISNDELILFNSLLEIKCIENGFNGSILVLNNFTDSYNNFNSYNFHPNYKKTTTTDYNKYIDDYVRSSYNTNTVFFNFNNSARLCIPNRLEVSTIYKNNSIYIQDKYIKKVIEQYKNPNISELNKILLINSWNEWGENMAIEPGKMNGTKYLQLLKSNLLSFIVD